MSNDVYITALGKYLPGKPISNQEMEQHLGLINGKKSKHSAFILRQNKIKNRHYAVDTEGYAQYTNAQLAANAIKHLLENAELTTSEIEFLAAATTQGDLLVPGFASSVHAEAQLPPIELANFQSVCASSMMAMKSAYLQIKADEKNNAIACASEMSSRWFQPGFYEAACREHKLDAPTIDMEFLRWTLSDGAGAALLENRPNLHGHSLKVEWIDLCSYADRFENCMYAGTNSNHSDDLEPWAHYSSPSQAHKSGAIMLKQDFDLLYKMFPVWIGHYMQLIESGKIVVGDIDYFLAHYSAHSLRQEMIKLLKKTGAMIPEEKWFTNLYQKGNTGSASIYIMLEELFSTKPIEKGQKILCFVPESGRCIISFMLLTIV